MGVEGQYNVANAIYLHVHTIQFLQMVGTSLQFLFSDTVSMTVTPGVKSYSAEG
jgi:hypothetical protein